MEIDGNRLESSIKNFQKEIFEVVDVLQKENETLKKDNQLSKEMIHVFLSDTQVFWMKNISNTEFHLPPFTDRMSDESTAIIFELNESKPIPREHISVNPNVSIGFYKAIANGYLQLISQADSVLSEKQRLKQKSEYKITHRDGGNKKIVTHSSRNESSLPSPANPISKERFDTVIGYFETERPISETKSMLHERLNSLEWTTPMTESFAKPYHWDKLITEQQLDDEIIMDDVGRMDDDGEYDDYCD